LDSGGLERLRRVEAIARALGLLVRISEEVGMGRGSGWREGSDINFGWFPVYQPCPLRSVVQWIWIC